MLGLDALASAAYGPEAVLTVLLPLGAAASGQVGVLTLCIGAVPIAVVLSYAQTIRAYPNGGGSFTVANENLGRTAGLLAAAALCTDYALHMAVGISAGVAAAAAVERGSCSPRQGRRIHEALPRRIVHTRFLGPRRVVFGPGDEPPRARRMVVPTATEEHRASYVYDSDGHVIQRTLDDQTTIEALFDSKGRVLMRDRHNGTGRFQWTYDGCGG